MLEIQKTNSKSLRRCKAPTLLTVLLLILALASVSMLAFGCKSTASTGGTEAGSTTQEKSEGEQSGAEGGGFVMEDTATVDVDIEDEG